MPIDFHDKANANTYASREAHSEWAAHMQLILDRREPGVVADIGCGGGIYSRAWKELGADRVFGLDSSVQMIEDAKHATNEPGILFSVASAYQTGIVDATCDIVFSRAVVHHLDVLDRAMREAFRVLKPGGSLIVQDRSIEDVTQPASLEHFRAHFFSDFPRLLEIERQRRPATEAFAPVLEEAGFQAVATRSFWETRRIYQFGEELRADLLARTGRSILHELDDAELAALTETILAASAGRFPLEERDRWTIWTATKPVKS